MGQQDYRYYGQEQPRQTQAHDPGLRPPAMPPQFQRDAPPPMDGTRPVQQPAFTPSGYRDPQPPRGYYPPPQPQRQPQYAPGPAPRRRHRVFLWVFLAVQALFIVLIIVQIASQPAGPTAAQQAAQQCANHGWYPLFKSQADCQVHFGHALNEAGDIGKGIGVGLIVVFWIVVDFFLGLGYGIYRLASRR